MMNFKVELIDNLITNPLTNSVHQPLKITRDGQSVVLTVPQNVANALQFEFAHAYKKGYDAGYKDAQSEN